MKKFIFSLFLMFSFFIVKAQSLPVIYYNGENITNQTIDVETNDPNDAMLQVKMKVTNESSQDMPLTLEKVVEQEVEGSMNTFCFGQCVGPDVYIISLKDPVAPGDYVDCDADYYHNNNVGTTTIKYVFTNPDLEGESCFVRINFALKSNSIEDYAENLNLSVFPNPIDNNSSIIFDLPVHIGSGNAYIYSLTGSVVKQYNATPGRNQLQINASDLPSGVYLLSIVVDNKQLKTQKIVVL